MSKVEKMDYLGTPPEDWIRFHTLQMGSTPSLEEYTQQAGLIRETGVQDALFANLSGIVGNPDFALTSTVGIMMKMGLWSSVSNGELTAAQGVMLQRVNDDAVTQINPKEEVDEFEVGSRKKALFHAVTELVGNPDLTMFSIVHVVFLFAMHGQLGSDFTPEQMEQIVQRHHKATEELIRRMESSDTTEQI